MGTDGSICYADRTGIYRQAQGGSLREQAATIFAAREKLKNTLGREPALSELSEETGFNAEEIAQCELAVAAPDSLQRETGDGLTLEGMLGGESPEDGLIERIALREAIDELPEREKMTILLRFFKGLTQEQAARLLGVSQVQVSRLERRALEKLRASLSDGLCCSYRPETPSSCPSSAWACASCEAFHFCAPRWRRCRKSGARGGDSPPRLRPAAPFQSD